MRADPSRPRPAPLSLRTQLLLLAAVVGWFVMSTGLGLPSYLDAVVIGALSLAVGVFQGKRQGWW